MRKNRVLAVIACLLLGVWLSGCPKQDPFGDSPGPPPHVVNELNAAEAAIQKADPLSPSADDLSVYESLFSEAQTAVAAGDYERAFDRAKRARLEAERVHARLLHRELQGLNPAAPLTYHYRDLMNKSLEAERGGDLDQAISLAREARRQAGLSLEFQRQCLASNQQSLERAREEIELLFRPDLRLIRTYWRAVELNSQNRCEETQAALRQLREMIDDFKRRNLFPDRMFTVQASPEFVARYGNPAMFESVSDRGLVTQIHWVRPGTRVKFIRSKLFSPSVTYYLVEDPHTGRVGWMAEERVWPERAQEMKRAGSGR